MPRIARNILKIVFMSLYCVGCVLPHGKSGTAKHITKYLSIANKAYDRSKAHKADSLKNYKKALKYYQKAADLGSAEGYASLGNFYYDQKNYDKALGYYQKAANMGNAKGYAGLGNLYSEYENDWRDYPKALRYYQKAAGLGYAGGYFGMAEIYASGGCDRGASDLSQCAVKPDYVKSFEYAKKAARLGYAKGYWFMGNLCEDDCEGIREDYAKARQYYQKAGRLGDPTGYYSLAVMYKSGRDAKPNIKKAHQYYKKACDMGLEYSCEALEELERIQKYLSIAHKAYHRKNYNKAFTYFQKAASLASIEGYIGLGDLYSDYDSGLRDYAQALFYYKEAGDFGEAQSYQAYFRLGQLYESGDCNKLGCAVKPDYAKAMQYYKRAYNSLGLMYEYGEGAKRDIEKARQYHQKACNMGSKYSCGDLEELEHKH